MKPLGHLVLVKPNKAEDTKNGIIIPLASRDVTATVIAVGNKVKALKVGDIVKYFTHVGIPIDYKNEKHLFLDERTGIIDKR